MVTVMQEMTITTRLLQLISCLFFPPDANAVYANVISDLDADVAYVYDN